MPVISNDRAQEIPWRPGYRNFVLAGRGEGLDCLAGYSLVEPGAGAPLHAHKDRDEIFIVIEGMLEFRLGEERRLVGANHTVAIPAGMPHSFVAVGTSPAKMFTFMPRNDPVPDATTYFEGGPPFGDGKY